MLEQPLRNGPGCWSNLLETVVMLEQPLRNTDAKRGIMRESASKHAESRRIISMMPEASR
jgi:hypothetical protein